MTNTQPVEKQVDDDGSSLDVIDIFPTIQGEGPYAGTPAVFVRLAGCDLQCPMCDTNYTKGRKFSRVNLLMNQVLELRGKSNLVVITGGEPLRQNIGMFVRSLLDYDFQVQVETNGTLFQKRGSIPYRRMCIVCSPKTSKINSDLLPYITAYKYIVEAGQVALDGLPVTSLGMSGLPARPHLDFQGLVYVQPMDDGCPTKNWDNMKAAVDTCMKHGFILSLQMHKIANLP